MFWNCLDYVSIFWILGYCKPMLAHASSCELVRAQMLRMCLGDARPILKLEQLGFFRSSKMFFLSFWGALGLESISSLVWLSIKPPLVAILDVFFFLNYKFPLSCLTDVFNIVYGLPLNGFGNHFVNEINIFSIMIHFCFKFFNWKENKPV